ncbi:amidohydrolase family protein [Plectosphaerella plurivora]|uniref:Amidohydrolase family protein n=1 Tax=Plectosphaerella plurivora TaxID=936078 RepID=A0A9P9AAQ1_9PEZI|nr:amidohydrolase family protein [Plectosphaerella plurivora]
MIPTSSIHQGLFLAWLLSTTSAASILFNGGTIIAWSEEHKSLEIVRNGSLLITDDRIAAIYARGEASAYPADTEVIDVAGKIITPGFVDTHRHSWQSAWRTLGSNLTMWDYFHRRFNPQGTAVFEPEDIYNAHLMGMYEGLNAGVTTMLDHAHHLWTKAHGEAGLRASLTSGARVFHAYGLGSVGYDITMEEQAGHFRELSKKYEDALKRSTVSLGLSCDTFSFSDRDALEPVLGIIRDYEIPVLTTHMVAGPYGLDNTPEKLHSLGILNTSMPVVFGHASFLDQSSYELLKATDQYASITIESEMSVGQTNPTAHRWLDQASLGIDAFWGFSSDLLTQARMLLIYIRHTIFTEVTSRWEVPSKSPMSVSQAFLVATRSGGKALRRPDIGIIAEGAKADLIVWSTSNLAMLGWHDPITAILTFASVSDIQDVLVDGVFRKRDRKLLAVDLEDVKAKFLKTVERDREATFLIPQAEPSEDERFISGARVVATPKVDVIRGEGDG